MRVVKSPIPGQRISETAESLRHVAYAASFEKAVERMLEQTSCPEPVLFFIYRADEHCRS